MSLGIGPLELTTILFAAIVVLATYLGRSGIHRWSVVVLGCLMLAAVLTPPDWFSMLALAAAFIVVYTIGTRHHAGDRDPTPIGLA